MLEGEAEEFVAAPEAELGRHPGPVGLDRFDARPQLLGDLPAGLVPRER